MGCHKAEGCQTCDAEELFARGELRDGRDLLCFKFVPSLVNEARRRRLPAFDVCVSASSPSC